MPRRLGDVDLGEGGRAGYGHGARIAMPPSTGSASGEPCESTRSRPAVEQQLVRASRLEGRLELGRRERTSNAVDAAVRDTNSVRPSVFTRSGSSTPSSWTFVPRSRVDPGAPATRRARRPRNSRRSRDAPPIPQGPTSGSASSRTYARTDGTPVEGTQPGGAGAAIVDAADPARRLAPPARRSRGAEAESSSRLHGDPYAAKVAQGVT